MALDICHPHTCLVACEDGRRSVDTPGRRRNLPLYTAFLLHGSTRAAALCCGAEAAFLAAAWPASPAAELVPHSRRSLTLLLRLASSPSASSPSPSPRRLIAHAPFAPPKGVRSS